MDIWIGCNEATAHQMVDVYRNFGLVKGVEASLFLNPRGILRMGLPPLRLEVTTFIDGVEFAECFSRRVDILVEQVPVRLIGLADLRINKAASGRNKDLADLDNLPEV